MNKNIVVFGCDNSGKTTLSEELTEKIKSWYDIDVEYQHSLGKDATLDEMHNFMRLNVLKDCVTIFDRFPIIEERVCGKILRGKDRFGGFPGEFDAMCGMVDLFIFCMPNIFDIVNWGDREQMDGIKDNVVDLINEYTRLAFELKSWGCNVICYNYESPRSKLEMLRSVVEVIETEGLI